MLGTPNAAAGVTGAAVIFAITFAAGCGLAGDVGAVFTGGAATTAAAAATGGFQSGGGATCTMLPHLGQLRICPIAASS